MVDRVALVVGASGVIGRYVVEHLRARGGWKIIAAARRPEGLGDDVVPCAVDLLEPDAARRALAAHRDVTHVICCAFVDGPTQEAQVPPNLALLCNAIEAADAAAPGLQRVVLVEGTKWYGSHLGPFRTPAREDDARCPPPMFYHDQEDWLRLFRHGKRWSCTAIRPHTVCGYAPASAMNLMMAIGVYAAICRELGWGLEFPGKPGAFDTLYQVTDAAQLARGLEWAATAEAAADRAFNLTNGDYFRWRHVWPTLGKVFDLGYRGVRPMRLVEVMADKGAVWDAIVRKHGLVPNDYARLVAWKFADYVFGCDWDVMSATTSIRRAGFADAVDSEEMFPRQFAEFRARKILP